MDSSHYLYTVTINSSIDKRLDKYGTSDNNWGAIGQESEFDLSEWGGRLLSCSEA